MVQLFNPHFSIRIADTLAVLPSAFEETAVVEALHREAVKRIVVLGVVLPHNDRVVAVWETFKAVVVRIAVFDGVKGGQLRGRES